MSRVRPAREANAGMKGKGCSFPFIRSPVLTLEGQASCWSNCYLL